MEFQTFVGQKDCRDGDIKPDMTSFFNVNIWYRRQIMAANTRLLPSWGVGSSRDENLTAYAADYRI